jgi:lactate dehydrogenase-like 2-hydroxyacid dehydrogenase
MKPRIFVTRPLPAPVVEELARSCEVESHPDDSAIPAVRLGELCRNMDGLLVIAAPVNEEVLAHTPRLRVVANCGVGYDHIDVAACTRRGIVVTNTPEVVSDATADLTFALLLAVARRLPEGERFIRQSRWEEWQWSLLWGTDVHRKILGIYGLGRIGQAVARRARGFSMRIIYHDQKRKAESLEQELEAQFVDRETLLRQSDFLSLHVPLAPETHHLIGAPEFARMKPTAFLINTSRGPVVDEIALAEALRSRKIAGAALDVFEAEPRLHPDLLALANVVLTPHIGTATAETRLRMARLAAQNLLEALQGRRPPNVVNPEVYK